MKITRPSLKERIGKLWVAGGLLWIQRIGDVVAPLHAAPLVAARRVLPPTNLGCTTLKFLSVAVLLLNVLGESFLHADTLKVSQTGDAPYKTIQAAVNAAASGDTLEIGPGVYAEAVTVNKDLELAGPGPQYASIRPPTGSAVVIANTTSVSIFGLTLTSRDASGVVVGLSASLIIKQCVLAGAVHAGIYHRSEEVSQSGLGSSLVMDHCTIYGCGDQGVYWVCRESRSGSAVIRNSIISNNNRIRFEYNVELYTSKHENSHNLVTGKGVLSATGGTAGYFTGDPRFTGPDANNFTLLNGSAGKDKGIVALGDQDPDGTIADLGAYGGALSAPFWPYPANGPLIKSITIPQSSVVQGGKITIRATATTR